MARAGAGRPRASASRSRRAHRTECPPCSGPDPKRDATARIGNRTQSELILVRHPLPQQHGCVIAPCMGMHLRATVWRQAMEAHPPKRALQEGIGAMGVPPRGSDGIQPRGALSLFPPAGLAGVFCQTVAKMRAGSGGYTAGCGGPRSARPGSAQAGRRTRARFLTRQTATETPPGHRRSICFWAASLTLAFLIPCV